MNQHADVRHRFLQHGHTIENQQRDFVTWHQGRSPYVIWAIDVNTPAICVQVLAAQQHLADLLLEPYLRQPHITLSVCGFPAHTVQLADDFSHTTLEAQISSLRQHDLKPFEIQVDVLASFSLAPFFHIADATASVEALHNCLQHASDSHPSNKPKTPYVPHITVGLYAGNWCAQAVSQRLDSFENVSALSFKVSKISLMCYAPAVIGGTLQTIADYDLQSGEMTWHEQLSFS